MGPRVVIALVAFLAAATTPRSGASSQPQATGHLQDAKLRLSRLETALMEASEEVEARSHYLANEKVAEMDDSNHLFRASLLSDSQGYSDDTSPAVYRKIDALEEEKRGLWARLRKNNFDLHVLETRVREAEDRVEALNSRVEKMADVVTEQWIQIQQFEQALQLKQMKVFKARRETPGPFYSFLEQFTKELCGENIVESLDPLLSASRSYAVSILHQLEKLYSRVKKYHHELQGKIKEQMQRHEFMVHFAHDELVFLVASVIFIFPILGAWMLLCPPFT